MPSGILVGGKMSSFERAELNDKTRATNLRVDRKLKIEINAIQGRELLHVKELEREKKIVRNELIASRRMSSHSLNSPKKTTLRSPRLLRRESSPGQKLSQKMEDVALEKNKVDSLNCCLDVPATGSDPRRRSLPSTDKLHLPPITSGSISLSGSRRGSYNEYHSANGSRRGSEGNFDACLSTGVTPFLTPSASISSLVSSLSNSTSKLSLTEESGEIFERVRTFLEKLDEEKIQHDREKSYEDPEIVGDYEYSQELNLDLSETQAK